MRKPVTLAKTANPVEPEISEDEAIERIEKLRADMMRRIEDLQNMLKGVEQVLAILRP